MWKSIKDYNGIYEISNYGNVRRISKCGKGIYKSIRVYKKDTGYLKVGLNKNGKQKIFSVHRLILEVFVGSCPDGMEGCHNDGNLENNFVENLRWDTHKRNMQDSIRHKTFNFQCGRKGSRCNFSKLKEIQVVKIKELISEGYKDLWIGKIFGVNWKTIGDIRLHKTWKHIGGIKC